MAADTAEPKSLPRINEPAPDFVAQSTQGEIKRSGYRGRTWVVLFSHPADFTPVCTTEFVAFSKLWAEFDRRNVQLIGLSVDSIYSHIGWRTSIERNFGVKVPFPLIPDRSMKIAQDYGMIHPGASDTATVRAVFVIDDKGIIRASSTTRSRWGATWTRSGASWTHCRPWTGTASPRPRTGSPVTR